MRAQQATTVVLFLLATVSVVAYVATLPFLAAGFFSLASLVAIWLAPVVYRTAPVANPVRIRTMIADALEDRDSIREMIAIGGDSEWQIMEAEVSKQIMYLRCTLYSLTSKSAA